MISKKGFIYMMAIVISLLSILVYITKDNFIGNNAYENTQICEYDTILEKITIDKLCDTLTKNDETLSEDIVMVSGLTKSLNDIEYYYNKNILMMSYFIDDVEYIFTWEYSIKDANDYLDSTVEQLSLIELYPESELYTYSDWYRIEDNNVDIFWSDGNYTYVANIPGNILQTDIEFVKQFCTSKKMSIQ